MQGNNQRNLSETLSFLELFAQQPSRELSSHEDTRNQTGEVRLLILLEKVLVTVVSLRVK